MGKELNLPNIKIHNLCLDPLDYQRFKFFKLISDKSLLFASPTHSPGEVIASTNWNDPDWDFMDIDPYLSHFFHNP
jgi:hypothetical protein